jgi:hypothetical protein
MLRFFIELHKKTKQLQRQAETEAWLIPVDLGAVDSIQPMRFRVAVGESTGGKSLFAQISINTPQPLGSKNRPIRSVSALGLPVVMETYAKFEKTIALASFCRCCPRRRQPFCFRNLISSTEPFATFLPKKSCRLLRPRVTACS